MKDFGIAFVVCLCITVIVLGTCYFLVKQKTECIESMREHDPLAIMAVCGKA